MNKVTSRVKVLTAVMGLSLGAVIAAGNVNAAENILNDAIHDYSDDVSRNMQSSPSLDSAEFCDMKGHAANCNCGHLSKSVLSRMNFLKLCSLGLSKRNSGNVFRNA